MSRWILDTDHVSLLLEGNLEIQSRTQIEQDVAITIVTRPPVRIGNALRIPFATAFMQEVYCVFWLCHAFATLQTSGSKSAELCIKNAIQIKCESVPGKEPSSRLLHLKPGTTMKLKHLRNFFLSTIACLFVITISTTPQPAMSAQTLQPMREAESTAIAQGMENNSMMRYVAVLTQDQVFPMMPSTNAFGAAGAVLVGDRLIVRGDFSNLSSPLRDYATDPLNPPNPKITSGVHIHLGESKKNGPFQHALEVSPAESGLQGRFMGEYMLTSDQLQALANGKLYVDIHTKQNRAGELRGILKPY
jgi:CHRD domain